MKTKTPISVGLGIYRFLRSDWQRLPIVSDPTELKRQIRSHEGDNYVLRESGRYIYARKL